MVTSTLLWTTWKREEPPHLPKQNFLRWSILTWSGNYLLGLQMVAAALESVKKDKREESGLLKEVAVLEKRRIPERHQAGHQTRQPRLLGRIGNPWSPDPGINHPFSVQSGSSQSFPRKTGQLIPGA